MIDIKYIYKYHRYFYKKDFQLSDILSCDSKYKFKAG